MLNARIKADHDLLWDAVIGGSDHSERMPEVSEYLDAIQDRWWVVWQCEQLLAPPGACPCHWLLDLVTWQVIRAAYRDHVQATDDFYELCLQIEASVRDWETLKGSAARRALLESKIGVRKRREGRPRRVHLTEQDRATAKRILDHVRSTGSDHPGRIWSDGFVARMMPGMSSLRDSWCPWPAEASSQVQSAAAVVSETCALSEAQYRRRRSAMAARLLAAVGDCSFQLARKKLPDTLDSADGEFDQLRMRRAAEILKRVAERQRARAPAKPKDVDAHTLASLAERMESSAEVLRERLQRRGVFRRSGEI